MGTRTGFDELDDAHQGIWAGSEAVTAMSQYHKKQTPLGLQVSRTCEGCQVEVTSLISWAEVFCVSNKIFPQQAGLQDMWAYNERHHIMHPALICPNCTGGTPSPVFFPMGPTEAQADFSRAAKNGIIDPSQADLIRRVSVVVKRLIDQRK